MSLEHILLGMLREPASGYRLKQEFDEGAKYFWSAELSQIYPALQRLQKQGFLTCRRQPSEKGPPQKIYRRTAAGTRELHRWLRDGPVVGTERFAYIGQLIFMGELGDTRVTLRFIQQLKSRLSEVQQLLEAAQQYLCRQFPAGPSQMDNEAFHEWLCVRMGVESLNTRIRWCDEAAECVRDRDSKRVATRELRAAGATAAGTKRTSSHRPR